MLKLFCIEHIHTSACHPAANAAVERLVCCFKDILCKYLNDHPVHWVRSVPQACIVAWLIICLDCILLWVWQLLILVLHGYKPRLVVSVQLGLAEVSDQQVDVEDCLQGLQQAFDRIDGRAL